MNRIFVDTNVLVTATMREAQGHDEANRLLTHLLGGGTPWCLAWTNLYEFLRVVTHARVFPVPLSMKQALDLVNMLVGAPGLSLLKETERHHACLQSVMARVPDASGSFVHDCRLAALMVEHDVNCIVTADSHFRRFGLAQVVSVGQALKRLGK